MCNKIYSTKKIDINMKGTLIFKENKDNSNTIVMTFFDNDKVVTNF